MLNECELVAGTVCMRCSSCVGETCVGHAVCRLDLSRYDFGPFSISLDLEQSVSGCRGTRAPPESCFSYFSCLDFVL